MTTRDDPECASRLLAGLEREGAISATSRAMVERFMRTWHLSAFHALLTTELLSESELATALGRALGIPRLYHLHTFTLAEEALSAVDFRRARDWECLPLRTESRPGEIELVLADPTRQDRIDEVRHLLTTPVRVAVAERTDVLRAVDALYPLSSQLPSLYAKPRSL